MAAHRHKIYEKKFSSEKACTEYAKWLRAKLEKRFPESTRRICIGFHLRQVFDTSAPAVGLAVNPRSVRSNVNKVLAENRYHGLQTLNHVLDTLYYSRNDVKGGDSEPEKKLCIRVSYLHIPEERELCHALDRDPPRGNISIDEKKWINAKYTVRKGSFDSDDMQNISDFTSGKLANHPEVYRKDDEIKKKLETSLLFNDYTCGAEKLCSDLNIDHSLSAYRVITAAIYQLGRYACDSKGESAFIGKDTVTLLIRHSDPFSVVVGVTLIADSIDEPIIEMSKEFLADTVGELNSDHQPCNLVKLLKRDATTSSLCSNRYLQSYISLHQRHIIDLLCKMLLGLPKEEDINNQQWPKDLVNVIDFILYVSHRFCGERLEGRHMSFGFILGNPGLLTHTPREHPIPLEYKSRSGNYNFFALDDLMQQVHLVSIPSERAVVLPYYQQEEEGSYDNPTLAAYLLEFDEVMEEFRARPWSPLWCEQFIPYLYYTERFPWAIATYAGPGADFRVFAHGRLVAYHGEKGWHEINREDFICYLTSKAKMDESIARGIFDVSLQMSHFANPCAKGGMLIYLSEEHGDKAKRLKLKKCFSTLTGTEPERLNENPWLTRRNLMKVRKSGASLELDYAVAHTLLQATLLDGAVILQGKKANGNQIDRVEILEFSQRIEAKEDDNNSGPAYGTRRAAAQALMRTDVVPVNSVAIAVSSDGPIRVWVRSDERGKPKKEEPLVIGELKRRL